MQSKIVSDRDEGTHKKHNRETKLGLQWLVWQRKAGFLNVVKASGSGFEERQKAEGDEEHEVLNYVLFEVVLSQAFVRSLPDICFRLFSEI